MKAGLKRQVLLWIYILLVVGAVRSLFFILHINAPLNLDVPREFDVRAGSTFGQVVDVLEAEGMLDNGFDLKVYARLSGRANRIKAGEYLLPVSITPRQLLDKMVAGEVIYHQVVLVEGWTLAQALEAIQGNNAVVATLDAADPVALAALFDTRVYPEGLVFPDTYNFSRGTRDRDILLRARDTMDRVLATAWAGRDVGLPYDTPYEALIMASIVERETAIPAERGQIAGVFVRRLQRGMRLQTDPTVIYGLGDDFTGNLTRADLRRATPYNTYLNSGLPPTPIALPGRESITASLHPDEGDTLYFVARGDGSHQFSATLEAHNAAVRQYQLNGQADAE